jgi:hypothetical protein
MLLSGSTTGLVVTDADGTVYSSRFGISQLNQAGIAGSLAEIEITGDLRSEDGQLIFGTYSLALGIRANIKELRGILRLDTFGPVQDCFLTLRPQGLGATAAQWVPTQDGLYIIGATSHLDPVTGKMMICRSIAEPAVPSLECAEGSGTVCFFLEPRQDAFDGEVIRPFSIQLGF